MSLFEDDLQVIAARAARLEDRLKGLVQPTNEIDEPKVSARLRRWCQSLQLQSLE